MPARDADDPRGYDLLRNPAAAFFPESRFGRIQRTNACMSSDSKLYTLNAGTGAASKVGNLSIALSGSGPARSLSSAASA